jgi:murein DD-endopeptidase MepM/ murein hydrolase activator NlpD
MRFGVGRRARLILVGCLALGTAAAGASIAALQPQQHDVSALTQQLNSLEHEKLLVQDQLRGVKRRQRQVSNELASIDAKLDRTESRLQRTSQNVREARTDLEQASQESAAAEARLADHREQVAARLTAIYQQGDVRPIEVVLQATSFSDFANRLYLLDQVVEHDAELLGNYEEARATAEARRGELKGRQEELLRLRDRVVADRSRAQQEREYTERMKRRLLRDRAGWEKALAELEQDSREVETMLQRLRRGADGEPVPTEEWSGTLQWPLRGRVSSGYGYRIHPIYHVRKMHTGIDIAASTGTPIRAAAAGKVVHASRWGGYGNCVIIDHGSSMATLYAHCSRLAVKNGARVEEGDVVGYVGSTGLSTGPHLHFEVRQDGRHVDPMSFLK